MKDDVQKQRVSIINVGTKLMIADSLTKGLGPKAFTEHAERMGLINNP